MKRSIQYLMVFAISCFVSKANAQMAFNTPSAYINVSDFDNIELQEDQTFGITEFDVESSQDYLPFAEPLFGASNEGEEDITNFLPFAEPLFGAEKMDSYLPIEENNGYFIEASSNYQSDIVVFSDKNFNEIIISLDTEKQRTVDVSIFNAYGKQIIKNITTTKEGINDISIEVEHLTSGLYSMVIKNHKESLHKKFIIK